MKWISGFYLIFISLFVLFSINARSSNPEKIGDSLMQLKQYKGALIYYERQIFDSPDKITQAKLLLKKAGCQKLMGKYAEGLQELKRATYSGLGDSLVFEIHYQSALCAFLSSQFDEAATRIKMLYHFVQDTVMEQQSLLLETLVLVEQMKWTEAEQKAMDYIQILEADQSQKDVLILAIRKLFENPPKLKKENTGRWLNYFLPGSGQVYAGYPGDGLMSFLLNASSLAFGVFMIINGYYITGYIIGTGLLQKFYFGGLRHTEFLVQKTNYKKVRKFNEELKRIIIQ